MSESSLLRVRARPRKGRACRRGSTMQPRHDCGCRRACGALRRSRGSTVRCPRQHSDRRTQCLIERASGTPADRAARRERRDVRHGLAPRRRVGSRRCVGVPCTGARARRAPHGARRRPRTSVARRSPGAALASPRRLPHRGERRPRRPSGRPRLRARSDERRRRRARRRRCAPPRGPGRDQRPGRSAASRHIDRTAPRTPSDLKRVLEASSEPGGVS